MGEYEFENKLRKDQKADKIFNWLQNSILMGFCSFFIYKTLFTDWLNAPTTTSVLGKYVYLILFFIGLIYATSQIYRSKLLSTIINFDTNLNQLQNIKLIEKGLKRSELKSILKDKNYFVFFHHGNWWMLKKEIHLLAIDKKIKYFTVEPSYINPGSHISAKRINEFNDKIESNLRIEKNIFNRINRNKTIN